MSVPGSVLAIAPGAPTTVPLTVLGTLAGERPAGRAGGIVRSGRFASSAVSDPIAAPAPPGGLTVRPPPIAFLARCGPVVPSGPVVLSVPAVPIALAAPIASDAPIALAVPNGPHSLRAGGERRGVTAASPAVPMARRLHRRPTSDAPNPAVRSPAMPRNRPAI